MTEPQFTPQPWRPHDMEEGTIVAGNPGLAIALVGGESLTAVENEANFRLCIAAPQLFNAVLGLQGMLQLIASRDDVPRQLMELIIANHRWQSAEDALKLATSTR